MEPGQPRSSGVGIFSSENVEGYLNNLPVEKLVERAKVHLDELEYEQALECFEIAEKKDPNNCDILDPYGELLGNCGQVDKAQRILFKSIQLAPEKNPTKYLYAAQTLNGSDSVSYFKTAIGLLLKEKEIYEKTLKSEETKTIVEHLASAYASIAELYMTDCCDEPDAEEQCVKCLEESLVHDPKNIDALRNFGNYWIIRDDVNKAKEYLNRAHDALLELPEGQMPALETRRVIARLLIEAEEFHNALDVLSSILSDNEEDAEIWYLTAFSHFSTKNKKETLEALTTMAKVMEKYKINDPEIAVAAKELEEKLGTLGDVEEDEEMEGSDDDDGYETYSEEDEDA